MSHPADIRYFREQDQIAREQLADEMSALTIETALLGGHKIRYGFQRHEILDAEDVKNEFSPDVFSRIQSMLAEQGDFVEAGRIFAVEHTRAIVAIAKRHAGLRSEYLAHLDAEECANDRHLMRGEV